VVKKDILGSLLYEDWGYGASTVMRNSFQRFTSTIARKFVGHSSRE